MAKELRILGPDRFETVRVGERRKLKALVTEDGTPQSGVPVHFVALRPDLVEFGTQPDPSDIARSHDDGTAEMWAMFRPGSAGRAFQIRAHIFTGNGGETDTVWFSVAVEP